MTNFWNSTDWNYRPTKPNRLDALGRAFTMEQPEVGYYAALGNQRGLSRQQQDFFRQRPGQMLQRYNEAISQQLVGGGFPDLNPYDFFSGHDGSVGNAASPWAHLRQASSPFQNRGWAGFQNEFLFMSPRARGEHSGQRNPNTSFLFR